MKILCIEDEEVWGTMIARIISEAKLNSEFFFVKTLEEGCQKAKEGAHWDVILLDLVFAGGNGSHAKETISKIPELDQCGPVIVISGFTELFFDCLKAGAMDCISKDPAGILSRPPSLAFAIGRASAIWGRIHSTP